MSLNDTLAELFTTMAAILDIKGENAFKGIALAKVGRVLSDMTTDIRAAVEAGTLDKVAGIGPSSRKVIEEYVRTGRSTDYDELVASIPPGLLGMLKLSGMGPKTVALLWKERGVTSVEELAKAIDEGRLAGLKGVGEKKIAAMKEAIAFRAEAGKRIGIADALPVAESMLARLVRLPEVKAAQIAGSLRRRKETIGDVDLVCALNDPDQGELVAAAFVAFPEVQRINGQGRTKASIVTASGLQVDLRMVPAEHFGATLLYFTGSKEHNVRLRQLALDRGMTLNEWGLYDEAKHDAAEKKTGEPPKVAASKSEEEVYATLGLDYIEPELREDRGEVDLAKSHALPALVSREDLRGDLHCHTTASDGIGTIEEMAEAAAAMGYAFLAITDHSRSQTIANGLTAERLLKHVEAIRKVGALMKGITLLAGSEVDILADGRLDYEDEVLRELDWVVASPHAALKQDEPTATDRLVRAIENPYVNLIGHPTGRLIGSRRGLPVDWSRVYRAAASTGTALEINSGWPRLDLDDIRARGAAAAGVLLSINTDAHAPAGLATMHWGLGVARRAGLTRANVVNCMTLAAIRKLIAAKRG